MVSVLVYTVVFGAGPVIICSAVALAALALAGRRRKPMATDDFCPWCDKWGTCTDPECLCSLCDGTAPGWAWRSLAAMAWTARRPQ